ncbi:MAG TPA: VCBS repeat-containing protein [Thermoanaerobaculia bacterium]|nr:VCBS repeat-containing protein [Thermoanaerobaculia bacterium]
MPSVRRFLPTLVVMAVMLVPGAAVARSFVFQPQLQRTTFENRTYVWSYVVADINNDGKDEPIEYTAGKLIIAGQTAGGINEGVCCWLVAGKRNADHSLDFAIYQYNFYVNAGAVSPPVSGGHVATGSNPRPAFGDFNGDGYYDLVVTNPTNTGLSVLLRRPVAYAAPAIYPVARSGFLLPGDFTGDGRDDLVISNSRTIDVYSGNADGSLTQIASQPIPGGAVGAGDLNGDGAVDLIILNSSDVTVLLSQRNGSFTESSHWIAQNGSYAAVADLMAMDATMC